MGKSTLSLVYIAGALVLVFGLPNIISPLSQKERQVEIPTLPEIEIMPSRILQGVPVLVRVSNAEELVSITLNGKELPTFMYDGAVSTLVAIDLNAKPGTSTLEVSYGDASIEKPLVVEAREKIIAPLGIPEKLGGNTTASVERLVNTLAEENTILSSLSSSDEIFWSETFGYPLESPVVTDEYGYTRSTVGQEISHKGTEFRADEGTPIVAMNQGEVRLVREFRNYGKTIVIDHGLGLMSFYMHLSDVDVSEGEMVEKGERIGLSGKTGYAEEPHLHLSVRINHISIDPMVFLELFRQ